MKIDIHVHTKKTKKGDAKTREIDSRRFHEIISSTDVKIVAITNHNYFDLTQYNDFTKTVGDDFQIWPGVEIDIIEDGRKGHLLVIIAPCFATSLDETMNLLLKGTNPDNFNISIDCVISNFDKLKPLYVVHYKQKKPDLSESDIDKLIAKTVNKYTVLKETTNPISAGIFLSHGHSSIYGSDIQDWGEYQQLSKELPDLRLPVESFDQFCLLLSKDQKAINTLLDKKYTEKISIKPFEDGKPLELTVYDDINVFFGAKGTGKSKILEAIASHYTNKGISAHRFESGGSNLEEACDLNGNKISRIDLKDYGIDYCNKEIDLIRNAQEVDVMSMSKYRQFYSAKLTNSNAKRIKVKDFSLQNTKNLESKFESAQTVHRKFKEFKDYLDLNKSVLEIIEDKKLNALVELLTKILAEVDDKRLDAFVDSKALYLLNNLIKKIKLEVSKKTGTPAKPGNTGFRSYAFNRLKIEFAVKSILDNIAKKFIIPHEYIGNLDEKGDLYCETKVFFQDGHVDDKGFKPIKKVTKKTQKDFSKAIMNINKNLYFAQLFEEIAKLNSIEEIDSIPTILELLVFDKYFTINEEQYTPSTGESSMLLLHKELKEDKDVYILDEPEKSLGNEYINNVIVPLIKEKAKSGKKIFIATHDANIAVRTLPYKSVFRIHKKGGYETFVGNPFSNHLININNEKERKDWKEISMRTLEGGRDAFGERGRIYGNP
jgi:predicted ATPase